MVVERVRLDEVDYVEFISGALFGVGYTEEEPLTHLRLCPIVKFQFQVILELLHLGGPVQVSRLKSGLKDQCRIIWPLQIVVVAELVKVPAIDDSVTPAHTSAKHLLAS